MKQLLEIIVSGFNVNMTSPTATSGPELNQPEVTQQQQQQQQGTQQQQQQQVAVPAGQDYYKSHPKTDEEKISPLIKPTGPTLVRVFNIFEINTFFC